MAEETITLTYTEAYKLLMDIFCHGAQRQRDRAYPTQDALWPKTHDFIRERTNRLFEPPDENAAIAQAAA